jgi:hypothetical protein
VRWKDNDSSYDVELSVRRKHPPFDRNLRRKKCTKTAPTPRLPGAITLSSELRFVQTLYRWKEDVESFPTICCMTHFEFQKTSKTAPKIGSKTDTRTKNRGGFRGSWRGRISATWQYANSRGPSRRASWLREACTPPIKDPPPPHLHIVLLGL